jgi:hypothetical protein
MFLLVRHADLGIRRCTVPPWLHRDVVNPARSFSPGFRPLAGAEGPRSTCFHPFRLHAVECESQGRRIDARG